MTLRWPHLRVSSLLKWVAVMALVLWIAMHVLPKNRWQAMKLATHFFEERRPSIHLDDFYCRQAWKHEGTGSWLLDYHRRDGEGGMLVVIDHPDIDFPSPDIYELPYVDWNEDGLLVSPVDLEFGFYIHNKFGIRLRKLR